MAQPIPVVPQQDPGQTTHEVPPVDNILATVWFDALTLTDIPAQSVGWLVANGWRITRTVRDNTTVPPTVYYDMSTDQLNPTLAVVALMNSYVTEANYARTANNDRYAEIINNWTEMISSTQTHAVAETEQQNACLGLYLTDLNTFMDEIRDELAGNIGDISNRFPVHETTTRDRLTGLGTTDLARINEQFASTLSDQQQQLTDRGLYSSAITTDITARNTRDRDEQIQLLNDRLNREHVENEHQLWAEFAGLAQFKQQAIVEKLNVRVAQLEGFKRVHDDNMRLMAYQLDTRNKLLTGLYSFVERRDDIMPQWESMATMAAALGEAGGGSWIQP